MTELKDWLGDWSWKDLTNYWVNTFNSITKKIIILSKFTINVNKVIQNYYFIIEVIVTIVAIEAISIIIIIIKVMIMIIIKVMIIIEIYFIEMNHSIQLKDYWIIKCFMLTIMLFKSKDSNYYFADIIFDFLFW